MYSPFSVNTLSEKHDETSCCCGVVLLRFLAVLVIPLCLLDIIAVSDGTSIINKVLDTVLPRTDHYVKTSVINTFGSPRLSAWLIIFLFYHSGIHEPLRSVVTRWHFSDREVISFLKESERYDSYILLRSLFRNSHKTLVLICSMLFLILLVLSISEMLQFTKQIRHLILSLFTENFTAPAPMTYTVPVIGMMCLGMLLLLLPTVTPPTYKAGMEEIPSGSYGIIEVPRGVFCLVVDREHRERPMRLEKSNFYKLQWESVYVFVVGHLISDLEEIEIVNYNNLQIELRISNLCFTKDPDLINLREVLEPTHTFSLGNYNYLSCSEPQTLLETATKAARDILNDQKVQDSITMNVYSAVNQALVDLSRRIIAPDNIPYEAITLEVEIYKRLDEARTLINEFLVGDKPISGHLYTFRMEITKLALPDQFVRVIEKIEEETRKDKEFGQTIVQGVLDSINGNPILLLEESASEKLMELIRAAKGIHRTNLQAPQIVEGFSPKAREDNHDYEREEE